ncbi:tyrosine-type recombinase/integrase [Laribacter hongkongensis]|uniref:Integrase n=1 Tax=Laribacter hongkongensis TaxID=168471 RepID=A0A248LHP1_9NEIS|nr:integrase arm-type DNA-binding domain-containing protein [Laribacter hongkongensis]ASJ23713.1 integrase [Laribacter hongkongensis]MCG9042364.1 tyrosine-type recombinase/integrase [Laribacter hongkongensis]MCG9069312.1 tyrosine-type recombinase/integrase [Laribacter hongkongensis]MCG9089119.1 tyrosine-type recombinase/integrase [Laribacter hongkongensis]MCG9111031.1 tyrosine-type recombinase/integrase [Laribacter hongkongensis]
MPLTDTACRNAKPADGDKPIKLSDGLGLHLLVNTTGKYWRLAYRFGGKQKTLALGVYPAVSLKDARERRDEARKLLAADIDPGEARKAQKAAGSLNAANSFEVIAREWHGKFLPTWTTSHADKIMRRFERDVFPWLGSRPVAEIDAPALLAVLRRVESRGAIETAHRAMQSAGQVFRYAIATGRAQRNPAADLVGALAPAIKQSFPTITDPIRIAELLRAIDGYQGTLPTLCALRLAPLVFVRPGELRKAEWSEIDLDGATWIIPAERMKMREKHVVPLSEQAVSILRELHPLTGGGRYVFPGARTNGRPMSENTINAALRRLGYDKDTMTGHGFRHMASTLLNEQGWNRDAIERQMAHAERNQVRAVYNYAEYLPERRKMMQAWSDYLDALKVGTAAKPLLRVA